MRLVPDLTTRTGLIKYFLGYMAVVCLILGTFYFYGLASTKEIKFFLAWSVFSFIGGRLGEIGRAFGRKES